jgi:acyl-CoA synthetase (NDP forming)
MVEPGADLRVALSLDPALGPVLTFGLGGVHAHAIGDQAAKLPPFGRAGARALVQRTRAASALAEAGADVDAVIDLLVRVARLADQHPEIDHLDLNPILAGSGGVCVTDAIVHVSRVDQVEVPMRRL